jgi:hypothetical protein
MSDDDEDYSIGLRECQDRSSLKKQNVLSRRRCCVLFPAITAGHRLGRYRLPSDNVTPDGQG